MYTVLDSIYRAPLSVRERDGAPNSFSLAVASVKEVPFAFGSAYWTANPPSLNIKYSASLGCGRATFGTQVGNAGNHISPNGQTAFLFARNSNGTASNFLIGRIFNVEIHKENQTLRDFIPVRKGSVGYMYDKVSGQLFGNQGTGDFVLGPDK